MARAPKRSRSDIEEGQRTLTCLLPSSDQAESDDWRLARRPGVRVVYFIWFAQSANSAHPNWSTNRFRRQSRSGNPISAQSNRQRSVLQLSHEGFLESTRTLPGARKCRRPKGKPRA